jgi:hypothetical protein
MSDSVKGEAYVYFFGETPKEGAAMTKADARKWAKEKWSNRAFRTVGDAWTDRGLDGTTYCCVGTRSCRNIYTPLGRALSWYGAVCAVLNSEADVARERAQRADRLTRLGEQVASEIRVKLIDAKSLIGIRQSASCGYAYDVYLDVPETDPYLQVKMYRASDERSGRAPVYPSEAFRTMVNETAALSGLEAHWEGSQGSFWFSEAK